jgi:cold shock CspA family protein
MNIPTFISHWRIKDINVTIRDAFKAVRRQLQGFACKQSGAVKHHEATSHARVTRLLPKEGYGLLETEDGEDIYFHRNSVLGSGFDELGIGTEVSFAEEMGDEGPQTSTVKVKCCNPTLVKPNNGVGSQG